MADSIPVTTWPFAPNWRESYTVSYEFKTDIFISRSGREQRRAGRTTPRKALKYTVTRANADMKTLNRFMARQHDREITMADLSRHTLATGGPEWMAAGNQVIVSTPTGYVQTSATEAPAVSGGFKFHPALPGRLADRISVKLVTPTVAEVDVVFNVTPGVGPVDDSQSPIEIFNGREVFTFEPNWSTPLSGEYIRSTDTVDFSRGRIATFTPVTFAQRPNQFQLLLPTASDRAAVVALFHRMKGQRGEFYLPSFEDDFDLIGSAGLTATVRGVDIVDTYVADETHRAVVITRDRRTFYRRIVSALPVNGNTEITTDVAWPCPMDADTEMSWLLNSRFAVDQLDMEVLPSENYGGRTQISTISLEDMPAYGPDVAFSGLDGAAQWAIDFFGLNFFIETFDKLDFIVNYLYPFTTLTVGPRVIERNGIGNLVDRYARITL